MSIYFSLRLLSKKQYLPSYPNWITCKFTTNLKLKIQNLQFIPIIHTESPVVLLRDNHKISPFCYWIIQPVQSGHHPVWSDKM